MVPAMCLRSAIFILAVAAFPDLMVASETRIFLNRYCTECHDSETKKGGLDLSEISLDLTNPQNFQLWVKVHDRVASGEMPPKKKSRPKAGPHRDGSIGMSMRTH